MERKHAGQLISNVRPQERIMKYEVHYHDGFFEVKTHGDAEPGGFREFLDILLAHEKWKPGTPILSNHSELNTGPLTVDDIKLIVERAVRSRAQLGHARIAMLVARNLEYGLARMWEVFVAGKWDVIARVFRSIDLQFKQFCAIGRYQQPNYIFQLFLILSNLQREYL
jgi:hypothetical protein